MNTITQIRDFYEVCICPKCNGRRACFSFRYDRQHTDEPLGLTITCRCGHYWYERSADYEEPVKTLRERFDDFLSPAVKGLGTNEYNQLLDNLIKQC